MAALETAAEIHVPVVVLGELRAGFAVGRHGARNERTLTRFLMTDGVNALPADEQTTHHHASLYRQLRKQGTPIPTNDMWIAALALQHNLVLCDRDRHFDHLPQLARIQVAARWSRPAARSLTPPARRTRCRLR